MKVVKLVGYSFITVLIAVACGKKDDGNNNAGTPAYSNGCQGGYVYIGSQYGGCVPQAGCTNGYGSFNGQCYPPQTNPGAYQNCPTDQFGNCINNGTGINNCVPGSPNYPNCTGGGYNNCQPGSYNYPNCMNTGTGINNCVPGSPNYPNCTGGSGGYGNCPYGTMFSNGACCPYGYTFYPNTGMCYPQNNYGGGFGGSFGGGFGGGCSQGICY